VEVEHFVSTNWSLAAFFDTGNAMNHLSDPLEQGAGAGVRWHTIIGPIRLDFARALTEDDRPWRIHLNIGPDL
jgi:translocation and assembly module TamA